MGVSYNKMATVVPSVQLDFYFVVKLLALRVLQVGALIFIIIVSLVFLFKALKVRTVCWRTGAWRSVMPRVLVSSRAAR